MFERDGAQWIISSLDPVGGKGERLASIPFSIRGADVSPDGDAVAIVVDDARPPNRIRIYSLRGEPPQEIAVDNVTALVNLDWSGTGAGFFSTNLAPDGTELIFVRMDGTSRVLWSHEGIPVAAISSPDGAHLAIVGWTRQSNVWMLTDS